MTSHYITQVPRTTKRLRAALPRPHPGGRPPERCSASRRGPISRALGALRLLSSIAVPELLRVVSRVQPAVATPFSSETGTERGLSWGTEAWDRGRGAGSRVTSVRGMSGILLQEYRWSHAVDEYLVE